MIFKLPENNDVSLVSSFACIIALNSGATTALSNREFGAQVAIQKKGIERVLTSERQVLGRWADGTKIRDVEEAILLTPAVAERWCGYLQHKHKWTLAEHDERLVALMDSLQGRARVLIRLAILERRDPLDWADVVRTTPEVLDEVSVRVIPDTPGPDGKQRIFEADLTVLEDRWATTPDTLVRFPWYQAIDDFAEWAPEPSRTDLWDGLRRGGNRMMTVEVKSPSSAWNPKEGFMIVIRKGEKTLRAKFPASA